MRNFALPHSYCFYSPPVPSIDDYMWVSRVITQNSPASLSSYYYFAVTASIVVTAEPWVN
jgi:hypothetical protein